jgi:nucleoside-diphosphate-sugar epimerase
MKILVTGANGFVGSHLIDELLKKGHDVFALMRNPLKWDGERHARLTIIKGDLDSEVLPWVNELPNDLETVVHTAGIVHHYLTDEFFRVNAEGTLHLIESLKNKYSHLHFILISSLAAGGPGVDDFSKRAESDLDLPVSLYGQSKKKAEDYLKKYAPATYTLSVVRPPMVIGPRDPAVLDVVKMVQNGMVLLPGTNSLNKRYSFVCVYDLVASIVKIVEVKRPFFIYSAHPKAITFFELTNQMKRELNKNWVFYFPMPIFFVRLLAKLLAILYRIFPHQLRLTPDKIFELEATNWSCDQTVSENELGMVYQYDLEKTIKLTLADYKKRKWIR